MRTSIYIRRMLALLWPLVSMVSNGQVLPTQPDTHNSSLTSGFNSSPDRSVKHRPLKGGRSSVNPLEGEVVLSTGLRLRGTLNYQPLTHTLQVWQDNGWQTYQANQLRYFVYTDPVDKQRHHVTAFTTRLASGEVQTLLLEELVPGAPVPLLQLPSPTGRSWAISQGLPLPRAAIWQTEQPCFVWFDGRLLAPDVFVRTEIDALLTIVPNSVQYWAADYPRPTNVSELMTWLSGFDAELKRAGLTSESHTTPTRNPFVY